MSERAHKPDANRRGRDDIAGERDHLRRLLCDADPAGNDTGLDPVTLANLRREITRAGEDAETDSSWLRQAGSGIGSGFGPFATWTKPALAATAMAVVATTVWLSFSAPGGGGAEGGTTAAEAPEVADAGPVSPTPDTPPSSEPASETQRPSEVVPSVAPVPAETDPAANPPAAEAVADAGVETTPAPSPAGPEPVAPEPAALSPAIPAVDVAVADKRARTVQFTAPRGTRIIWTLDPNFESPIAGQEPRQEQTR